jgi:hypothetical protein
MSKPDMARGWDVAMDLLADQELERLEAMSDSEVTRELYAEGVYPSDIPSADHLEARAQGRAAAKEESLTAPAAVRAPPRRVPVVVWLLAAALCAVAIAVLATRAPQVIARWKAAPASSAAPSVPPPSLQASRAAALRNDAARACERGLWETCAQRLDDARSFDPTGELDDGVTRMRAEIAAHREKPARLDAKPGPGDTPGR